MNKQTQKRLKTLRKRAQGYSEPDDSEGLTKEQIEALGEEVDKHPIMNPKMLRSSHDSEQKAKP